MIETVSHGPELSAPYLEGEPGVVLLVSASPAELQSMKLALSCDHLITLNARTGSQALELMRSILPDLVVSDVILPDTSGAEFCRTLKGQPSTADVPLLFTASLPYDHPGVTLAFAAGADDYLELKCVDQLFRCKVERLIKQRRLTLAHKEVEARYRSLIESLPAVVRVAETVPPYSTIYVSSAVEAFGYSVDEWQSQPDLWVRLLHPEDRDWILGELELATISGNDTEFEYRILDRDGAERWIHDRGKFVRTEADRRITWQGVMLDITDRKRQNESLKESQERLLLVARAISDVVWDWDIASGSVWWNEGLKSIFGYQAEEIREDLSWWTEHIHPDDRERVLESVSEVLDSDQNSWSDEYRYQRADGSYAHILDRAYVLRSKDGAPFRMLGAMIDQTDRKEGEEALRQSEKRFRRLFAAAERQGQEMALLDRVRTTLGHELDFAKMVETVVEAIASTFGYPQVSICLLKDGLLDQEHHVGYEETPVISLDAGICAEAIQTGDPILSEGDSNGFEENSISQICVPLFDNGGVVGILRVESSDGVVLTEDDLRLLIALGEHISIGLERARLYSEVRSRSSVLESITDPVVAVDRQWRIVYLNGKAQSNLELFGKTGSILGSNLWEEFPSYMHTRMFQTLQSVMIENRSAFDDIFVPELNAWMGVHAYPFEDGVSMHIRNITEQKQAQENIRRENEYRAALYETSLGLIKRRDSEELLEEIVARAAALVGANDSFIALLDPGENQMQIRVATGNPAKRLGRSLPAEMGVTALVWKTGQPQLVEDYPAWDGRIPGLDYYVSSAIAVPLKSDVSVVGVLCLISDDPGRRFSEGEFEVVDRFGQLASIVLHNSKLYSSLEAELTERKHAEQELRLSEERFSRAFAASPLPMSISTVSDRCYLDVNESFVRVSGYTRDDIIGQTDEELMIWGDPADPAKLRRLILANEEVKNFDFSFRTRSGEIRKMQLWCERIMIGDRHCILSVCNDITDRIRIEEELRVTQFSIDHFVEAVYWLGEDGRILYVNDAACAILGYSRDQLLAMTIFEIDPLISVDLWNTELDKTLPGTGRQFQTRHRRSDGSVFPVEVNSSYLQFNDRRYFCVFTRNISERKAMETALKHSERQYRALFESANDPIFIIEPDTERILALNRRACETYGFSNEELVGKPFHKLSGSADAGSDGPVLGGSDFEGIHIRNDGTSLNVMGSNSVIEYESKAAIMTIIRDITDIRRLQLQLIQSEKLAALGQLVSGVAHELNNPLTSVIGYTQLMLIAPDLNNQMRQRLELVSREAERTRRIVQNLLSFSRQHKPSRTLSDVNELINRTLELRSYDMRVRNIVVEVNSGEIPRIMLDEHQIQQVLLNIIVNAEQALHSRGSGKVMIGTSVEGNGSDQTVTIRLSDDGPGIDPDVLKKLFDPFFTTKPVGEGTGLGLSITYGIIKEHGGSVRAESEPGQGATFLIELPANGDALR